MSIDRAFSDIGRARIPRHVCRTYVWRKKKKKRRIYIRPHPTSEASFFPSRFPALNRRGEFNLIYICQRPGTTLSRDTPGFMEALGARSIHFAGKPAETGEEVRGQVKRSKFPGKVYKSLVHIPRPVRG